MLRHALRLAQWHGHRVHVQTPLNLSKYLASTQKYALEASQLNGYHISNNRLFATESVPSLAPAEEDVITDINQQIQSESYGRLFAVIYIAGTQFKVTDEDVIAIKGYWAPDIGDRLRIEKVLLVGGTDFTLLGKPMLPRDLVRIEGTVIEKTMTETKLEFRFKPRSNYRRTRFYRIPLSMVRINIVKFDGLIDENKEIEGLRPAALW